ncbi:MAG: hypothetical protein K1W24_06565 [Lachnospiraceae bacterium]
MKNSEYISNFLKFLKDIQTEYNIATDIEEEANKETQDILHRLELGNDTYHDMARMSKMIKGIRLKRRKAKDTKTEAEPVIRWIKENQKIIHIFELLLGDVRKAEKANENRYYINKTDILRSKASESSFNLQGDGRKKSS